MIRVTGTVVYQDGRRHEFTGGPREWVAWEQYALSKGLPTAADDPRRAAGLTMTWFLAYRAVHRTAGGDRPGFEAWLDLIADVTDVEVVSADPTPPAASPVPSSSSPSAPESTPAGYSNGMPRTSLPSWTS